MVAKFFNRIASLLVSRPWIVVMLAVIITALTVPGLFKLETDSGFDTMVSPEAAVLLDNADYEAKFGSPAVAVLLQGDVTGLLAGENLEILRRLHARYGSDNRFLSVFSPLTFAGMAPGAASGVVLDENHALVILTPRGNLSGLENQQVIADIDGYFAENPMAGFESTVIGQTKIVNEISGRIMKSMAILMALAVLVMVGVLATAFRVRWRLLSLLVVGVGTLWTFGLIGWLGLPVSMTTMAVLPVLIGLGIDYAIQFHNRYQEALRHHDSAEQALRASVGGIGPVVALALATTVISFITLLINRTPMIRDFGIMLAAGVVLCYLAALFLMHSVLRIGDVRTSIARLRAVSLEASGRMEKALSWMVRTSLRFPLVILVLALAGAGGGLYADRHLEVQTDYLQLIPRDVPALQDVAYLAGLTGEDGSLVFLLEAPDVTSVEVLKWLQVFEAEQLSGHAELLRSTSPVGLVLGATGTSELPDQATLDAILENIPAIFKSRVISEDKSAASVSFAMNYESFDQVIGLLETMTTEADPPQGVRLAPVGSYALAGELFTALTGARTLMNIICLGAIALVLLLAYRRLGTVVSVVLTAGLVLTWSSLGMFVTGIPLNPMTAVLGVIVIGTVTEYVVLILSRYREEKALGETPAVAMTTAVSRVGRAVVASSLTTLGGFGVLIASDFVMIRDFGIATVIGLMLCIIASMMVMPPIIVWLDGRAQGWRNNGQP